jgi:putative addiction module killer protein
MRCIARRDGNVCVTVACDRIREYLGSTGASPFGAWRNSLDATTRARVTVCVLRLEAGNFSAVKSVGAGVHELRMDFGPGYRVYFGKDGERLVILLGGGSKQRQQSDIDQAKALWQEYKRSKRRQEKDDNDTKLQRDYKK